MTGKGVGRAHYGELWEMLLKGAGYKNAVSTIALL